MKRLIRKLRRSSDLTAPPVMRCVGHIDAIRGGRVIGWITNGDGTPLASIDVAIDGQIIACDIPANEHRIDVAEAGFGDGRHGFSCPIPPAVLHALSPHPHAEVTVELRAHATDQTLLARKLTLPAPTDREETSEAARLAGQAEPIAPPAPEYSARIEAVSATGLRGWAVEAGNPDRILAVDILIDGVFFCRAHADQSRDDLARAGLSGGRGGLRVPLPLHLLEAGRHDISLVLPDGQQIGHEATTCPTISRGHERGTAIRPNEVTIIVPVHNAADDVATCIARLAAHTPAGAEVLFIDDASTDPAIGGLLARAAKRSGVRVLRNDRNLGFTRTVNRGITEAGRRHVVLLNSDARVTPGWLEGMLAAATSRPRVATVTAMSDRAGAFSAPELGNDNELPPGVDELTFARAFRRRSLGLYPVVPTGNGFCMFINRACLDAVGMLDAEAFPRGYGEENDFCMRAGRMGWLHLVDDRTYVFHDRSKSFGEAKTDLMASGRAVIDARYPEYKQAIGVFSKGVELAVARMQARRAVQDCLDPRAALPRVLFVTATQTGGTPQTNMDLMNAISPDCDPWLMRCDSRRMVLLRWRDGALREVAHHILTEPVEPIRHQSDDYDRVLADWLRRHDIATVHIRHLAWHSLSLPAVAKAQGCTVVFSFHDFYTLCPSIKLLDGEGRFYGGDLDRLSGPVTPELWPEDAMPPAGATWIRWWRERFGRALAPCDAFVTTSDSARDTILRHLPGIEADRFHVIPHGRDFARLLQLRQRPRHGQPVRILVPGNISRAKGLDIISRLLEVDRAGLLEFHILGKLDDKAAPESPRLIQHGPYGRDQFAERVRALDPHLGAVFSIWDETWCHTLTELWSVGIPALVFDFPTVAARMRESGAGWVLPHQDIEALYRRIVGLAYDAAEQDRADAALAAWQAGAAVADSTHLMAARYLETYRIAAGGEGDRPLIGVCGPASRNLNAANASTEIRLWARTRNTDQRPTLYVRMTPTALLANLQSGAIDGALIQRNAIPETLVEPFLAAVRDTGRGYVLDLDDDLLDVPEDKDPDGAYHAYAPLLRRLIEGARLITASTGPLAARLRPLNTRIEVLPERLDEALWRGAALAEGGRAPAGLYMGSNSHKADFDLIAPALAALARRHPGFRLKVVGVHDQPLPDWAERIPVPDTAKSYHRFVPWLKSLAGAVDFSIAPLEDTRFNRLKSPLKLLDGLALGLPVIASDVTPYREAAEELDGVTLVANTTAAWENAIEARLRDDSPTTAKRGQLRGMVLGREGMTVHISMYDAMLVATLSGAQTDPPFSKFTPVIVDKTGGSSASGAYGKR